MSDQLIFDLPCYPALGFNDFFVSKANKLAFDLVKNWAHWSNDRLLVMGAKGSGKTHLSNVWANLTNATFENVIGLDFNLQNINAIVLENIELANFYGVVLPLWHYEAVTANSFRRPFGDIISLIRRTSRCHGFNPDKCSFIWN